MSPNPHICICMHIVIRSRFSNFFLMCFIGSQITVSNYTNSYPDKHHPLQACWLYLTVCYVVFLKYILLGLDAYLTELKAEGSIHILNNVIKPSLCISHCSYASSWKSQDAIQTKLKLKLNLAQSAPSLEEKGMKLQPKTEQEWKGRAIPIESRSWVAGSWWWTKRCSVAASGILEEPSLCSKPPSAPCLSRAPSDKRTFY